MCRLNYSDQTEMIRDFVENISQLLISNTANIWLKENAVDTGKML